MLRAAWRAPLHESCSALPREGQSKTPRNSTPGPGYRLARRIGGAGVGDVSGELANNLVRRMPPPLSSHDVIPPSPKRASESHNTWTTLGGPPQAHLTGSVARTRTPTACCASTSPRAPTYAHTRRTTSPQSPTRSTPARAKRSAGPLPPTFSNNYSAPRRRPCVATIAGIHHITVGPVQVITPTTLIRRLAC